MPARPYPVNELAPSHPRQGGRGITLATIPARDRRRPLACAHRGGVLAGTAAKYLLIIVVVAFGLWVAWRLLGAGLPITALTMVSIAGVASSPFAWEHHWV